MKTLSFTLAAFLVLSAFVSAETYTSSEFVVPGEPIPGSGPGTTTVTTSSTCVTTAPGTTVVTQGPPVAVVTTTPAESPVYVGMSKYLLVQNMGEPVNVQKFNRFAGRQQGVYDEVWTYQAPTGVTYVYIKERRVAKVENR